MVQGRKSFPVSVVAALLAAACLLCTLPVAPARAQAPIALNSATQLQREMLRRLGAGEPLADLFLPLAAQPDTTGWRWMAVRGEPAQSHSSGGNPDEVAIHFNVTLEREAPIDADCPVVEEVIQRSNGVQVWQERGHVEASYLRTRQGWRIAKFVYRVD